MTGWHTNDESFYRTVACSLVDSLESQNLFQVKRISSNDFTHVFLHVTASKKTKLLSEGQRVSGV